MSDKTIEAIIAHVESLMPSLQDVTSFTPTTHADMGPIANFPAIYVHILIQRLRCWELINQIEASRIRLRRTGRSGVPLTMIRGGRHVG